ncbi:MAG: heme lyase CcmF/NrfE family subunit [Bradymonadia bacterium]
MIDPNQLGSFLLYLAMVLTAFSATASVVGRYRADGRLMIAGERAGYALCAVLVCASFILVHSFLDHDYANKYVQRYSDNNMPWYYLVAAFWGGQAGSLMFWSLVLAVITAIVIWQNRDQNRDILPTVIATLMVVQAFFLLLMIAEANPFATFRVNEPPINGNGLEPLLQNPAMTFHPPSILSGYIWFTVPFAFAVAAMIHKRLNDSWIRTTRRYAVVSWGFLSIGNLFGGMWAYQELGWGGFWGWDPVENASLMPWFTATAYLHSVMIQERRGMLKVWNIALVFLTYFLTVFGTFLTRSGLIDSVHTFAQSDIGDYFVVALSVLAAFCIILLVVRVADGSLKSKADIDSIASREGVFLLNNLLLLGCMGVVMFGTLGSKISAYFWQETTYTPSWFNAWMVPGGLALIVLMGIGPLIPWRKVTLKSLRKNFLVPTVVSLVATGLIYAVDAYHLQEHVAATHVPFGEVPLGRIPLVAELTGIYALIGFFGVFFVTYTLLVEFHRGARIRGKNAKESYGKAVLGLLVKQKRRYGGYLTHLGFAGLFLGFIGTGLKTEQDLKFNAIGQTHTIEGHQLTYLGMKKFSSREYAEDFTQFKLARVNADGSVGDDLGVLSPSRRRYHGANVRLSRTTTEKDEIFLLKGNVYLSLTAYDPAAGSWAEVKAHFNPMLIFMWLGGALLLVGVAFTLWPDPNPYPVYTAATKRRRKQVAGEVAAAGAAGVTANARVGDS